MNSQYNRREFLAEVGRGMLVASVGYATANDLDFAKGFASEAPPALEFGPLEPLVRFMQETPPTKLLPALASKLKGGESLRRLVAAAAFANARTFGGEDYIGFHTMMALAPAFHMSKELPEALQPLPIFKVLYRNTNHIQEQGGRKSEVLHAVALPAPDGAPANAEALREAVRRKDVAAAEATFASLSKNATPDDMLNQLLFTVEDHAEVHRVVLPYRAWDLMDLIGKEQAETLLRQSVRYCVKAESWPSSANGGEPRAFLPKLLEDHKLLDRTPGTRSAEDSFVDQLSQTIFKSTPEDAAAAAANALAEGFSPSAIGEAVSIAANQLILRDAGRPPREEFAGAPPGSVHGASVGVHACDSACAWRNLARVSNARNTFACIILGAYQVARDRHAKGDDLFFKWEPLPAQHHLNGIKARDAAGLLAEADDAIRQNLQGHAAAVAQRYGESNFDPRPLFDLLLRYAVSEDGSLHAEKFYRTVVEEFASTRPALRWRHLIALARVTASEYGHPAPGMAETRELLKV